MFSPSELNNFTLSVCDLCKMLKTVLALEHFGERRLSLLVLLQNERFWCARHLAVTSVPFHDHVHTPTFQLEEGVCVLQVVVNCYGESGNRVCGAASGKCMCV